MPGTISLLLNVHCSEQVTATVAMTVCRVAACSSSIVNFSVKFMRRLPEDFKNAEANVAAWAGYPDCIFCLKTFAKDDEFGEAHNRHG